MNKTLKPFLCVTLLLSIMSFAHKGLAQNTGGVFPPIVREGHNAVQYRITYDDKRDRMAQRVHAETSLNDQIMIRGVGQVRRTDDENNNPDYFQGEVFWQLTKDDTKRYHAALRFDGRVRADDRPHFLGVHFTNQYALTDRLTIRGLLMNTVEFGENRNSGVEWQTRAAFIYNHDNPFTTSFEVYNNFGFSDDLRNSDEQNHQVGPHVNYRFDNGLNILGGYLFGLTPSSADQESRLWVTKTF